MNTQQIRNILMRYKTTRDQLGSVCPADCIPLHVTKRPQIYIVNTDPRGYEGRHWVAFYFPVDGQCEYFDSCGRPPRLPWFKESLKNNGPSFIYNVKRIQDYHSKTCGCYCVICTTTMSWLVFTEDCKLV